MKLGSHDIGVCSWSLHPKDMADLIDQMKQAGLAHVQLGLVPPLTVLTEANQAQSIALLKSQNITVTGGMVGFAGEDYSTIATIRQTGGFVPDADWASRKAMTENAAKIAKELALPHISLHVGFVPHKNVDAATYTKVRDRIREVADMFKRYGLALLMETGQEPAAELAEFLHDLSRDNVFINFDPANMILYGAGDPIEAIKVLGRFIRHVHVKDATASGNPGQDWGAEVPFGTGQVPPDRFIAALHAAGYRGPLCIEREAGTQRLTDVKYAVETLKKAIR